MKLGVVCISYASSVSAFGMSFMKKKSLGSFQSDPSGEYIHVLSAKTTKAQLGQIKEKKKGFHGYSQAFLVELSDPFSFLWCYRS